LAGFEHRFATVGGVRLHFVSGGKADGDVVVLLAGSPESWFAWQKVMPLLANTYNVIAPDLPGQGDSDRPATGSDTKTPATTVHGLLGQLGTKRCFLAGHDVGTWVAYAFAALFGDEVLGLALLAQEFSASHCRTLCRPARSGLGGLGTSHSMPSRTSPNC
jgi:pimeloyl-ACP methyl ester carboxylesterase